MAVLVTRPHPDDEATAGALRARGFEVLQAPMLRFEPVPFLAGGDFKLQNGPCATFLGACAIRLIGEEEFARVQEE